MDRVSLHRGAVGDLSRFPLPRHIRKSIAVSGPVAPWNASARSGVRRASFRLRPVSGPTRPRWSTEAPGPFPVTIADGSDILVGIRSDQNGSEQTSIAQGLAHRTQRSGGAVRGRWLDREFLDAGLEALDAKYPDVS